MRVPLTSGAYQARGIIASAQRCVNLFAERNPQGALAPFTFYNAPGLTSLVELGTPASGRGLYRANNGSLYYAAGAFVYLVNSDWTMQTLGVLTTTTGPVSMADNGTTIGLVDGSANGYQIDMTTNVMTQITEAANSPPSGTFAFYGANRVDVVDGYMLFNHPGTRNFYSTYANEMVFDALYFAAKNGFSDNLVGLVVTRREIWLIGEKTTEIWYNAGATDFPFQIMPGPFIQYGCIAPASIASVNGSNFWVSQDQAGQNIILRTDGYVAKRISNHAMENEMLTYPTVADAQAFCFQIEGHAFYQVNFPAANKTWRWDEATPEIWHEAVWVDENGQENRHRAACAAFAYGKNVCADWETGDLYEFDLNVTTDNGDPMYYRRGYPHMMDDGRRVIYPGFVLDVQAATSPYTVDQPGPFPLLAGPGGVGGAPSIDAGPVEDALLSGPAPVSNPPIVWLRWSDDRGRTWSNPVAQSLGATGQYLVQPAWNRLGMARDRVFEIFGVVPGKLAINGAFLDPKPIPLGS
tara:strand:- start:10822 stop:12390 length:1569 start_codon:yes stop_codon:yes gene_type:complete